MMNKISSFPLKKLLNALFFQIGWFICVFGGDLFAIIYTATITVLHIQFFVREKREYWLIILFPALGILGESLLILGGWHFSSISSLPIWLACLWILLGLTLFHSLRWLSTAPFTTITLSLIAPAFNYYTGGNLIGLTFSNPATSLMLIGLLWSLLLPSFTYLARDPQLKTHLTQSSHTKAIPLFLVVLLSLTPIDQAIANTEQEKSPYVIGVARDLDNNNTLYRELYFKHANNIEEVRYLSPDDTLIAVKHVDFSKSLINPEFKLENILSNEMSQAKWKNNQLHASFREGDKTTDEVTLREFQPNNKNLVIDAGFDNFIRNNWEELLKGDLIDYEFLLTSRLTTLSMSINNVNCKEIKVTSSDDIPTREHADRCFITQLKNPFLKLLTDPIYLRYNGQTKNLVQFSGIGNINNEKGDTYHVNISYNYSF